MPSQTQDSGTLRGDNGETAPATTTTVASPVGAQLTAVINAAKARDWATARAALAKAREVPYPTLHDLFEIDVVTSYVDINTGEHAGALKSYRATIANALFATDMSPQEQAGTLRNAMVLCNEAGDFKEAIALGGKLIATGRMDDVSALALATAYYGEADYPDAQMLAQKAIDAEVAAGKKPDDAALQIVLKSKAKQGH